MKKFKNKYRIPSARLENWDYGANGAYFITICTHKMQHYFGEVYEREMQLNELGKLAHDLWQEITNQFPYVELGNFVIMPNHMHGILIINKSISVMTVETRFIASPHENEDADSPLIDSQIINPPLNNNDMDPQLNDNATVETLFIASPHENENTNPPLIDSQIINPPLNNNNDMHPQLNDNETVETRFIASPHENEDADSPLIDSQIIDSPLNNNNMDPQLNDNATVETRFIAFSHENEDADSPLIDNQIINPPLNNNNDMHPQLNNNETLETRLIASVLDPRLIDHEIRISNGGIVGDKNPMLNENVSRIIRWYKGRCSFEMRKIHADFKWHSRFHDHIIRNSKSFETIQTYIENNPFKWGEDKFYKKKSH